MRRVVTCIFLAMLVVSSSCRFLPVKIADIKRTPERYENRVVSLHGKVAGATKLPFMVQSFYQLDDGSGTITVITRHALPPEGRQVFVRGKVESAFRVGGQSFGLAVMEGER